MTNRLIADLSDSEAQDIFGKIDAPQGVKQYNIDAGGEDAIGILIFMSRFIQLIFVIAGIWVIYNVISAGFIYLGSEGDAKSHQKVRDQITNSVIGLLVIVASYAIASLIGVIFFGNAEFILKPDIQGPGL